MKTKQEVIEELLRRIEDYSMRAAVEKEDYRRRDLCISIRIIARRLGNLLAADDSEINQNTNQ